MDRYFSTKNQFPDIDNDTDTSSPVVRPRQSASNTDVASNTADRKILRSNMRFYGIPPVIIPRASLELEMLHQDLIWNDFMNMVVDLV